MKQILKEILKKYNISQKELADKLCVTPQAVSNWTRGETQPSHENVIEINKIFGIDLTKEITRKLQSNKQSINHLELSEINNYEKAKKEANSILTEIGIESKYSHSVYMLCNWLLTAVIGLTYHQMIHNNDKDEEIGYWDIFGNLGDYFEDLLPNKKEIGLYENHLEYNFYQMGGDLFESFGEYKMINHDYCFDSMYTWHKFEKSLIKSPASPVYNELLVALREIIDFE